MDWLISPPCQTSCQLWLSFPGASCSSTAPVTAAFVTDMYSLFWFYRTDALGHPRVTRICSVTARCSCTGLGNRPCDGDEQWGALPRRYQPCSVCRNNGLMTRLGANVQSVVGFVNT